ncbi:hypothetical protein HY632_04510 [Candidatus Uhrbacteria bacterium]|nr:hypothetical protein [Candidatus Uhrbacteria bacterium]
MTAGHIEVGRFSVLTEHEDNPHFALRMPLPLGLEREEAVRRFHNFQKVPTPPKCLAPRLQLMTEQGWIDIPETLS